MGQGFIREHLEGRFRKLLLASGICLTSAALVYWLWSHMGLSGVPPKPLGGDIARPGGWRRFSVLVLPALCFCPTLSLLILQRLCPRDREVWRLSLDRDLRASLIISVLWAFVPLAWRHLAAPLAYIGSVYILGLLLKGVGIIGWLFADFKWNRRQAGAAVLAFWVLLGGLAVWAERSLTTYSDAIIYLLNAHALARHGNLDIKSVVQKGEYRDFYWARWSKKFVTLSNEVNAPAFPFILAGPYFLAGRLGVLLFHALLLACAMVLTTGWLVRETRAGPKQCLAASMLVFCTAPVIFLSQVEFPDTVGLFAVSLGLWALSFLKDRFCLASLTQAGLLAAVYFTKKRMAISFVGLSASVVLRFVRQKLGSWWLVLFISLGLVGLAYGIMLFQIPQTAMAWEFNHPYHLVILRTLAGLFWDQSYGLFTTAPIFFLALAGAPVAFKRWPSAAGSSATVILISLGLLVALNWWAWHGGFATPFRYLVLILPVWAVFLLPWMQAWFNLAKRIVLQAFVMTGTLYLLVCTVLPLLRPNRPVGVSRFWAQLESWSGLTLHHLLPSSFMHTGNIAVWALGGLATATLMACWLWHEENRPSAAPDRLLAQSLFASAGIVLLAGLTLFTVARLNPPTLIEAELMTSPDAPVWSPTTPNYMRGRVFLNGYSAQSRIWIPKEAPYRLNAVFVAQAAGRLIVQMDERQVAGLQFEGTAPPKGKFINPYVAKAFAGRQRTASATVRLPAGWHRLKLIYLGPPGRNNWFLLDYIKLSPMSK